MHSEEENQSLNILFHYSLTKENRTKFYKENISFNEIYQLKILLTV